MKHICYVVIFIVVFIGCKKNPVTAEPPTSGINIRSVVPTAGLAGDAIKIYGANFDSTFWHNSIFFSGVAAHVDSGNSETLYTRIPFKASTGNLSIAKYRYDAYTRILTDSAAGPQITVLPIDTAQFNLVRYSGPQLTEVQSQVIDDRGIIHKWSGSKSGDTIVITKSYPFGDEGTVTMTFWFYQPLTDSLPSTVKGYVRTKILEFYDAAAGKGIVAIQAWNLNDKISGIISVPDDAYGWIDHVFWFSFK